MIVHYVLTMYISFTQVESVPEKDVHFCIAPTLTLRRESAVHDAYMEAKKAMRFRTCDYE